MKKSILLLFAGLICIACESSKNTLNKTSQLSNIQESINNDGIHIEASWAYPLQSQALNQLGANNLLGVGNTGGRINLIGNLNYLKINKDSVSAYLPYYGERRVGGGYSGNTGIEFDGIPVKKTVTFNEKKQRYDIDFSITQSSENYDVSVTIFPNKRTQIYINSTYRSAIRYDAEIIASTDE